MVLGGPKYLIGRCLFELGSDRFIVIVTHGIFQFPF